MENQNENTVPPMFLRSFVEQSKFGDLINLLLIMHNGKLKEKISIVILSGDQKTGKSILALFMFDMIEALEFKVHGWCDINTLNDISIAQTNLNHLEENYAISASSTISGIYSNNANVSTEKINKLHLIINEGVSYRKPYQSELMTVKNPATLIIQTHTKILPYSNFESQQNHRREYLVLDLPYKKRVDIDVNFIMNNCKTEFDAILGFIEMKSMCISFIFLISNIRYELPDIKIHYINLLIKFIHPILDFETKKMLCESRFTR